MNSDISITVKRIEKLLVPNEKNQLVLTFVITSEDSNVYQYVSEGIKEGFISFETQFLTSMIPGDNFVASIIKKRVGKRNIMKIYHIVFEEDNTRKTLDNFY